MKFYVYEFGFRGIGRQGALELMSYTAGEGKAPEKNVFLSLSSLCVTSP